MLTLKILGRVRGHRVEMYLLHDRRSPDRVLDVLSKICSPDMVLDVLSKICRLVNKYANLEYNSRCIKYVVSCIVALRICETV